MSGARLVIPVSCFVTGTDTGVGKSRVASALLHAWAQQGRRAAGFKPVAAGAQLHNGVWINEDVEALRAAGSVPLDGASVCPYLLADAVAPHIAAERAGVVLEWPPIARAYAALQAQADVIVVEGAGGFRVPLGPAWDTADLAQRLALPVVLVVGLRLGCLNHAVLTAEAVAARGLRLAGWVGNTIDPAMPERERNLASLADLLAAPCLGVLPWMPGGGAAAAAAHLDLCLLGPS